MNEARRRDSLRGHPDRLPPRGFRETGPRIDPIVDRRIPFDRAPEALDRIEKAEAAGKVVLQLA